MKLITIFLFILILLPLTSAVETQFTKNSSTFDQGETLIAIASGNFIDQVTADKVFFYQDHVRIPMEYELGKIKDDFYIYALLANKPEGNYSIQIKDVRYMKALEETDEDIVLNFTITNETADFYVTPGFVSTSEEFSLEFQNLKDKKITISLDSPLTSSEESLELSSGQTKKIIFTPNENPNETLGEIKLSSENTEYLIPLFIQSKISPPSSEVFGTAFRFEPDSTNVSLSTNSTTETIAYIVNYGSEDISNISFIVTDSLNPYVNISPKTIDNLESGEVQQIKILIKSDEASLFLNGDIIARSGVNIYFEDYFSLSLEFIPGYIPSDDEEENRQQYACAQLGGTVCTDEQICNGQTIGSTDSKEICCISPGVCEISSESESSSGKIIGWSIIILVILLLFWFFTKYKKVRPKTDIFKIGKEEN